MKLHAAESDFKEMVLEKFKANTYTQHIGFNLTHLDAGIAEGELAVRPEFTQQLNFLHGGLTATIGDIVMGFAAFTLVRKGQQVVTADIRVSYLNPAVSSIIYAKGVVIKAGKRLHFCEAELWTEKDGQQLIVAKASSTMAVIEAVDILR
jgi:uncharacterized protein (TIGR00369 family)